MDIDPEGLPDEEVRMVSFVVGVRHAVLTGPDWSLLSRSALTDLGRALRRDPSRFPEGVNVNFSVPDVASGCGFAVTYERGVEDLTDSCGTGCTASALAATAPLGLRTASMTVRNPGGENRVELSFEGDRVLARLIGRTALVAEGRWYREESEGRGR
jgi:diaminopimelate epimerase